SVQPDAFGTGIARGGQVVREFDIGVEPEFEAVEGHGRTRWLALRTGSRRAVVLMTMGARDDLLARIENQLARVAVDGHWLSGLHDTRRVLKSDDGRHAKRARENRGVIRPAAGVGRESPDLGPVDL